MLSSSFQRCAPSRETHHTSSVPISVTCDSRRTGKTAPCSPSTLSVTSSGLSSSISVPQFSSKIADVVLLSNRRTQEAELGGFAYDQAKLPIRDLRLRAFFHAERHDTKRLQRSFHAGHGGHGAFDPDVVGARGATADSDSLSTPRSAIVSCTARYRMLEIRRIQDLRRSKRLESFFRSATDSALPPTGRAAPRLS